MSSAEPLSARQQKKVIRVITRLKHSLAADREIEALLLEREKIESEGAVPRLDMSLNDLLGDDS